MIFKVRPLIIEQVRLENGKINKNGALFEVIWFNTGDYEIHALKPVKIIKEIVSMNKKILSWLESLMEEEALGLAPNPYQEAMKKNIANQATAQAVQEATQNVAKDIVDKGSQQMANVAQQFYEVSSAGDKRFSALYATFKPGTNMFGQDVSNRTIESVYQHGVKQGDWITNNNYKTGRPMSKAIITGNTEDDSYTQGYLPLWQEWAKQNPDLIEDLRTKSKGMQLSDKFARTRVSQARALTDILNTVPSNEQLLSKLANSKDLGEAQFKVISGGQTGFSKFKNNDLSVELEKYNNSIQNEYDVRRKALDDLLNFASNNKALTPVHKERMLKRIPIISNNLNKLTPEKISFSDMQKTYNNLDKNVYQKYTDEQINNYINKLDRATDLDVSDMLESANNYSELSEEDLDYYLNLLKTISRNRRF